MPRNPWRAIAALAVLTAVPSVPALAEPVTPSRVMRAERAGVSPELWSLLAESRPFDSLLVFEIPNDLDQVRGKHRIVFDKAASADEALQTFESPLAMPARGHGRPVDFGLPSTIACESRLTAAGATRKSWPRIPAGRPAAPKRRLYRK